MHDLAVLVLQAAVLVTLAAPMFLRLFGAVDSVRWRLRQASLLGMAATILAYTASAALAVRALARVDLHPLVLAAAALVPLAILPFALFVLVLYVDHRRIVVGELDLDST